MKWIRLLGIGSFLALGLALITMAAAPSVWASRCEFRPLISLYRDQICSQLETAPLFNYELYPTELNAEWLDNGAAVTTELKIETTEELLLEDAEAPVIGKAVVLCSGTLVGWVGPSSLGFISEVLNLAGEAVSTVPLSGLALECTAQAGCETSSAPLVWAVNLGWEMAVHLTKSEQEEVGYIAIVSPHSGGGHPGWEVECLVLGTNVDDECTLTEDLAELALEGSTSLAKFNSNVNVQLATCSLGGKATGTIEGEGGLALVGGGELTASREATVD